MSAKAPNYHKQLILALALFIFGSLAYWLEYSKKPKEEAQKAEEKKIFAIAGASIKRVEILGSKREEASPKNTTSKEEPYVLNIAVDCQSLAEKLCKSEDTSKWELSSPLKTRADDPTVNSLLRNFGNMTVSDVIDLSTDTAEKRNALLKDYGLGAEKLADPRARRLRLSLENGKVLTAYFGDKHPLSDGSFAIVSTEANPNEASQQKVFIVPEWQLSVFNQRTSYFRDKKIIGGNEAEIASFTLSGSRKNPGQKITLKKDPKTSVWELKSGTVEFAADVDTVEGVLTGINLLAARDFAAERKDDSLGKKALAGAALVLEITLEGKNGPKHLRIYEKSGPRAEKMAPRVYVTVEGLDPVYEIDPTQVDRLDLPRDAYRPKRLIAVMDRFGVEGIQVDGKGKKPWQTTLRKKGQEWQKAEGKPVAKTSIDPILDRLSSAVVKAFAGSPPAGDSLVLAFGTPERPLGDHPAYRLEFWRKENRLFARSLVGKGAGDPSQILELDGDFASQLPWDEGFLKSP